MLLLLLILIFVLYSILLFRFWQSWKQLPVFVPTQTATTRISVIIPARNEENNIAVLLQALQEQSYPASLTEIIVVDDHSTDRTAAIAQSFTGITLVQLKEDGINSYKKKAIEKGIAAATGELIITTDADCLPGPEWLSRMAAFYEEKQAAFVAAPVVFTNDHSLLQVFQALDFLVLQGITAAGVSSGSLSMCNGANMAYTKNAFQAVDGFKGIDQLASGDDMLLMHKIRTLYPAKVDYLKSQDAIVRTPALKTWKAFFNQRIRWASKATFYDDKKIFLVLMVVYLFNFSFLVLVVTGFFNWYYWLWLLGLLVAKTIVEYPFFISVSKFFDKTWAIRMFFFFQPLHILYTVISGLFGQFGKYEWKGRKVK